MAEGAGAEAFFGANDFAAGEAIRGGGEEGVEGRVAGAGSGGVVAGLRGGKGGVGLKLEGADCGVEVLEGGGGAVHGGAAGDGDGCF